MPTDEELLEFKGRSPGSGFSVSELTGTGAVCGVSQEKLPTTENSAGALDNKAATPTVLRKSSPLKQEPVTPQNFSSAAYRQTTNLDPFSNYQGQGFSSQTVQGDGPSTPKLDVSELSKVLNSIANGSASFKPYILSPNPTYVIQEELRHIGSAMNNTNLNQGSPGVRNTSQSSQSISWQNGAPLQYHTQRSPNYSQSPGIFDGMSYQGVQNQGQGQNLYSPQRGYSSNMGIQGSARQNMPSAVQQQGSYSQMNSQQNNPVALVIKFRARVQDLKELFEKSQGIPTELRDQIKQHILGIIREFEEYERDTRQEWEHSTKERSRLEKELKEAGKLLDDAELQIRNLVGDRSKVSAERDNLILKVSTLGLKTKSSSERIEAAELKWKQVNSNLMEKLRIQEEQLQGKRALWLEANPTSSARRDAMNALRDPFNSPSAHFTPGYATHSMTTMGSSSLQSPSQASFGSHSFYQAQNQSQYSGPPPQMRYPSGSQDKGGRRRKNLPTGKAKPGHLSYNLSNIGSSSRTYQTEPADDTPSMSLVMLSETEKLAADFEMALTKLFQLTDDWVRKYTNEPNQANDRLIATSNQILWDYMMNCTYPGKRQDSHTHLVTLLNDSSTRLWFVKRMIATCCTTEIMVEDRFLKVNSDVDRVLNDANKKLLERGLATEPRQVLINQKCRAILTILSSPDYGDFRAKQLDFYSKRLRDMLGPLLNNSAPRSGAGQELGDIVVMAWEICCKMYTSKVSFQVCFPDTAAKFTAATMKAEDIFGDPFQFQCQQTRIKLVITPVMTMRDDRGLTIMAKSVHRSTVLLMG